MKKTAILAAVVLLCFGFAAVGYGAGAMYNGYPVVNLAINGKPAITEVPAIVMDGRTLVPLRFIIEELGYTVNYDKETSTANIILGTGPNVMEVEAPKFTDAKTIYINGEPFCNAYKLPEPKNIYVVSEDSMRKLAELHNLKVAMESNGWVISNNTDERKYHYEAKVGDKVYFAHGSIWSMLKYLVRDNEKASSFILK